MFKNNIRVLILDPHYVGADNLDKVIEKQGIAWRKTTDIFLATEFYNFCLPLRN